MNGCHKIILTKREVTNVFLSLFRISLQMNDRKVLQIRFKIIFVCLIVNNNWSWYTFLYISKQHILNSIINAPNFIDFYLHFSHLYFYISCSMYCVYTNQLNHVWDDWKETKTKGHIKHSRVMLFCQTETSLDTTESTDCFASLPLPMVANSLEQVS